MRVVCLIAVLLGTLEARAIGEDDSIGFELPFPESCLQTSVFCGIEWEPMFPSGETAQEPYLYPEQQNSVLLGATSGHSEDVPEPTTWLLIGVGLSGIALYGRRRR